MTDEATERARLIRRAEVLQSRLLRSVDALAHRRAARAVHAIADQPTRARIGHAALGVAAIATVGIVFAIVRHRRRHSTFSRLCS